MDTTAILVIGVAVIMGWFAFGIIYNLRRGNAILRWMQQGLPQVGEKTTFRWLGTTVADMNISHPKKPFRQLQVMVVLAPRDVPWMWLFARQQGRKDTIIFRSQLLSPPCVELELGDPASWTGRTGLGQASGRGWTAETYQGLQLLAPRGSQPLAQATLAALEAPAQALSPHLIRLALRKEHPHLEIHLAPPDIHHTDARQWFVELQNLAQLSTIRR